MRVVGIDLGQKRLGIAVSDPQGIIAVPHSVVELTGNPNEDLNRVVDLISELEGELVVLGLPLSLRGDVGKAGKLAEDYAQRLRNRLDISVILHDERFTTTQAGKQLQTAGLSAKKSRQKIDMVAASLILQSWLDSQQRH